MNPQKTSPPLELKRTKSGRNRKLPAKFQEDVKLPQGLGGGFQGVLSMHGSTNTATSSGIPTSSNFPVPSSASFRQSCCSPPQVWVTGGNNKENGRRLPTAVGCGGTKLKISLSNPHECPDCHLQFADSWGLRRHNTNLLCEKRSHRVICNACQMTFMSLTILNLHKRSTVCGSIGRRNEGSTSRSVTSSKLNTTSASKSCKKFIAAAAAPSNPKVFKCSTCHAQFSNATELQRHHMYLRCTKEFSSVQLSTSCQISREKNEKAATAASIALNASPAYIYTGTRASPFCRDCGIRFQNRLQLRYHVQDFHKKDVFLCHECPLFFTTEHYRLEAHRELFHVPGGGEKEYTCEYPGCGEKFAARALLKNHQKEHPKSKEHAEFLLSLL